RLKPGDDLDGRAIVTSDRHRDELRLPVADDGDLEPFGPEEQRVGGNGDRLDLRREREVDEGVGPWQQLATWIVDVDLGVEGAGGEIDRVGRSRQRPVEGPPGKFVERDRRRGAGTR